MSEPAEHPDHSEDRPQYPAFENPGAGPEDRAEVRSERATEPIAAGPEDHPPLETTPAPQPPQYSAPPPLAAPPVAPAPTSTRGSGLFASRWVLSATTGVAGLLIGVLIGAVGVGLIGLVRHHGGPPRGDNRGQYQPDHRPRGGLPNGNQPAPGFH